MRNVTKPSTQIGYLCVFICVCACMFVSIEFKTVCVSACTRCICLCKYTCVSVCAHSRVCICVPVYLYLCGGMNCIKKRVRGGKKRLSSSRSTEVIMERSLAKLQLQVTQLTSDPVSPVKNEPCAWVQCRVHINEEQIWVQCAFVHVKRRMLICALVAHNKTTDVCSVRYTEHRLYDVCNVQ